MRDHTILRHIRLATLTGFAASLVALSPVHAQQFRLLQDDFPFQKAAIGTVIVNKDSTDKAPKGIAIHVGNNSTVSFDMDVLRFQGGWVGGFISERGVTFNGAHGGHPEMVGVQKFAAKAGPAWAGEDGSFKDTRPEPFGPMPKSVARYDGLYVSGDKVVLAYSVKGTKIYDQPSSVAADGEVAFVRSIRLDPPKGGFFGGAKTKETVHNNVAFVDGSTGSVEGSVATLTKGDSVTKVRIDGSLDGVSLSAKDGNVLLTIAKGTKAGSFNVVVWGGSVAKAGAFAKISSAGVSMVDFTKPAANRWPEPMMTKGALETSATPDGAYVTDSLTVPESNPWKRRIRIGGIDFFKDGKSAAVSTWDGDVFVISGIDEKLENLKWTRYASGLFDGLGLKIVDEQIYVIGRDGITRLTDINKDGAADYYENFNSDLTASWGFHEFVFDLQTDKEGNFYFAKAGPVKGGGRGFGGGGGNGEVTSSAGKLMKVSKDGSKFEVVANGLRAPNGIGVNPWNGQITTGDNEGTWVPACPINWIKPGGFYGVEETGGMKEFAKREKPLAWLHHGTMDNSGGGQTWVQGNKWGLPEGELLHTSYGQCQLFHVLKEEVSGQMQGGVVKFPLKFTSSAMRPVFNKVDGQLYVAGLQGWQTKAVKLGGIDRVRYTGKPRYTVDDLKVTADGVQLRFTQPLDAASVKDLQNFSVQRWNYEVKYDGDKTQAGRIVRSATHSKMNYGGTEVSAAEPLKTGRDKMEVSKTELSADGKTVTLHFADWRPAHQVLTKFTLKSKDGKEINQEVLQTVNVVPGAAKLN